MRHALYIGFALGKHVAVINSEISQCDIWGVIVAQWPISKPVHSLSQRWREHISHVEECSIVMTGVIAGRRTLTIFCSPVLITLYKRPYTVTIPVLRGKTGHLG
jgi:hypothetical protein